MADRHTTVIIVDDEETVLDVLSTLIEMDPSLHLVGRAADPDDAIEIAGRERPDVALVDVRMSAGGGPRATREIKRVSPSTRVLALSACEDRATGLAMLRAGAIGYVGKAQQTEQILRAIHRAVLGKASISPTVAVEVAEALVEHMAGAANQPGSDE